MPDKPLNVDITTAAYVNKVSCMSAEFGTAEKRRVPGMVIDLELRQHQTHKMLDAPKLALTMEELAQVVDTLVEAGGRAFGGLFPVELLRLRLTAQGR